VAAPKGTTGVFMPKTRNQEVARARRWRHLLLAPTIATVREGGITVPILSLMGRTTKLPSKEALGTWVPNDGEMEIMEVTGELNRERVQQWFDLEMRVVEEPLSNEVDLELGDMEDADRELMIKMLRCFPSLLEPREGGPPATTLGVEHEIHTGDAPPIKVRPRRHAHEELKVIDGEVDEMLQGGVVERSHGAWGFPVVLVKKKDGTVRFCIDYRMLNDVTSKDVYPLPRIDETLENMHGAQRFSSLDLHAGYWQVPVALKDRDKTGFVTRKGLFRFVRMPFGLANAPGTFQRMMDAVLRGLTWQCCLVYLDDVIIFTKGSVSRHVVELAAVLERLSSAGLSLKAKKCSFGTTRLEYLGHELDADGIRPMESLVRSVREFPVPEDDRAVKRFVHLAGYYRRFIANFGSKAAPMTMLLRKGSEWEWGERQQAAFDGLKKELTERPLLVYPDFEKPFKLVTDASTVGLGAALMQDQGKGEQPIAYASKVNSPTVAKYSITDLECAAVVWAIKLFRPYLYGRRFELVTDHAALAYSMRSKNLTGRLHRWSLQLQDYDLTITYRPGSTNVVADALSRAPVLQVEAAGIGRTPPRGGEGQLTDEELREQQQRDEQVRELQQAGRHGTMEIVSVDGLTYAVTAARERRVVVPAALRHKVLREAHDSIFAGHLRIPQTHARVAAVYWWPKMRVTVRQWVRGCRDCGTRKARPKEIIPSLRSLGLGFVGDRWALDVAGPSLVTGRGNRYVIAAVEYATRYAVAVTVPAHTAQDIARFIMERVILVHGPLRELVMDGAPELNGKVVEELVALLQARQTTPVPYRPALLGPVERFHRTWKDMVSMYVSEEQKDWDSWLPYALYAYNGARHTTTGYSPNELLMGKRLRAPNELLRASGVTQIGTWAAYHQLLVKHIARATEVAQQAAARDQDRRAKFYNHRVRNNAKFEVGDLVWVLKPPRGKGITKLAHQWMGPARVLEDAGFDNLRVLRLDDQEEMVAHCSFLTSYHCPDGHLEEIARLTTRELEEDEADDMQDVWQSEPVEEEEISVQRETTGGGMEASTEEAVRGVAPSLARQERPPSRPEPRRLIREHDDTGQDQRPTETGNDRPARVEQPRQEAAPTTAATVGDRSSSGGATPSGPVNSSSPPRRDGPDGSSSKRPSADKPSGRLAKKRHKRHAEAAEQQEATTRLQQRKEAGRTARAERATRRSTRRVEPETTAAATADADADCRVHSDRAPQEQQETAGDVQQQPGTAQVLRGRGRPRKQARLPGLRDRPVYGPIVERGRRRVRNRTGRYELQYEVEFRAAPGGSLQRRWVDLPGYEALLDDGKRTSLKGMASRRGAHRRS